MAVSAISGLNAMSMNPISSIRTRETKPEAYAVENQSEVSDAFRQSIATNGVSGIVAPTPVQYPTAQVEENRMNAAEDSRQTNQFFNRIASGFQGMNTSYDATGAANSYAMVGSNFDFAV